MWDHPRSRGVYRRWRRGQGGGPGSSPLARGLHDVEACGRPGGGIIPARAGFTSSSPTPTRPPSGSSPLARGLLTAAPPREPVRGIIPARAGFTIPLPRPPPRSADHPRSRGVYSRLCVLHRRRDGSSPLARGLRSPRRASARPGGIIPARAGFTRSPTTGRRSAPDHPRSRGVYDRAMIHAPDVGGSSPLARGLRSTRRRRLAAAGIIPARAGFTRVGRRPGAVEQDHPRSRGVYRFLAVTDVEGLGSSPLARGLRSATQRPAARRRIIPARAGFTASATWWWRSRTDHPRSRGVYQIRGRTEILRQGSSPLARGLRWRPCLAASRVGIIPARAGFTGFPSHHRTRPWDHPRSRGVYVEHLCEVAAPAGIIPARAGFTRRSTSPATALTDHPRSRGVYPPSTRCGRWRTGSSPLARGLQEVADSVAAVGGIIPARAGFTDLPHQFRGTHWDHPRSRGVYGGAGRRRSRAGGSSPLARGLLAGPQPGRSGRGIIPARAGFTPALRRSLRPPPDHPRSRGVY